MCFATKDWRQWVKSYFQSCKSFEKHILWQTMSRSFRSKEAIIRLVLHGYEWFNSDGHAWQSCWPKDRWTSVEKKIFISEDNDPCSHLVCHINANRVWISVCSNRSLWIKYTFTLDLATQVSRMKDNVTIIQNDHDLRYECSNLIFMIVLDK